MTIARRFPLTLPAASMKSFKHCRVVGGGRCVAVGSCNSAQNSLGNPIYAWQQEKKLHARHCPDIEIGGHFPSASSLILLCTEVDIRAARARSERLCLSWMYHHTKASCTKIKHSCRKNQPGTGRGKVEEEQLRYSIRSDSETEDDAHRAAAVSRSCFSKHYRF